MQHSRLVLNELEDTLNFWEDLCVISLLQSKALELKNIDFQNAMKVFGDFSNLKDLKNYDKFRTALGNKVQFDEKMFLPKVPQDATAWLDRINFARTGFLNLEASTFYPYVISHWLQTKKVFEVQRADLIPPIEPTKENYLNFLPCDSFIMSFAEPIEVGFETVPLVKSYKSCIVVSSGELIDTFWIPNDVKMKSLPYKKSRFLRELLRSKQSLKEKQLKELDIISGLYNLNKNPPFFFTASFHKNLPLIFFNRSNHPTNGLMKIYSDVYNSELSLVGIHDDGVLERHHVTNISSNPVLKDSVNFSRFFFETLNGFCKMMSEIKPKEVRIIEGGKDFNTHQLKRDFPWNEIPITKTDYLEGNDKLLNPLKVSYGSGEKSPHIRRGHFRNIILKNGSSQKVWIEQVIVREDKLKNGDELKGNVTLIKKERP